MGLVAGLQSLLNCHASVGQRIFVVTFRLGATCRHRLRPRSPAQLRGPLPALPPLMRSRLHRRPSMRGQRGAWAGSPPVRPQQLGLHLCHGGGDVASGGTILCPHFLRAHVVFRTTLTEQNPEEVLRQKA